MSATNYFALTISNKISQIMEATATLADSGEHHQQST